MQLSRMGAEAQQPVAAITDLGAENQTSHRGRPWQNALIISMSAHALFAAWTMIGLGISALPHKTDDGAIAIEMASAPAAPVTPPRQENPGPAKVQSVEKPTPVPQLRVPPLPTVPPSVKPEMALAVKPPKPKHRLPVMKRTEQETTAPPVPAVVATPRPQTAAPVMGANVATSALQTWEASLLAKLEHNKRYPGASQARGEEDVVYVHITLDRTGRLLDADIVKSHGYRLLDAEVLSLLRRSSPYDAPPATEAARPVSLVVPLNFTIDHSD